MLETLDHTIRIGSTPTFLYFDLYLYSAYAAHYVYYLIITCWKNMNVFEVIQENHLNCACSVSWDIYTHDKYSNIICFCTGGRKHRLLFTNFRNLNQLRKQLCYITTNHSRFYNSSVSSINLHSYFHKENHVMSYNVHFQI